MNQGRSSTVHPRHHTGSSSIGHASQLLQSETVHDANSMRHGTQSFLVGGSLQYFDDLHAQIFDGRGELGKRSPVAVPRVLDALTVYYNSRIAVHTNLATAH